MILIPVFSDTKTDSESKPSTDTGDPVEETTKNTDETQEIPAPESGNLYTCIIMFINIFEEFLQILTWKTEI